MYNPHNSVTPRTGEGGRKKEPRRRGGRELKNLRAILSILLFPFLVHRIGKIAYILLLKVIANNGNILKTIRTGKKLYNTRCTH